MTIEASVAALTTATTTLITAVGVQQTAVTSAVAAFTATTTRVAGLSLVDNTADAAKPVSTAAQTALDTKQATLISGVNIKRVNGVDLTGEGDIVIVRSATSLHRVAYDNRETLRTTVSQVDDATLVEGLGLFMWTDSTVEPDDDETCFTTPTGQWLLQAPAWDLINAWNLHETSFTEDWREDEATRFAAYLLANK